MKSHTQNTNTLTRPFVPNLVIPAQPAFVQAQAGTQSPPYPDPSFAKIPNPANHVNPVNLVKNFFSSFVFFFTSWFNIISKFIEKSGPPNLTQILPILPILTFPPTQNMSKTCQKWSTSCQK